MPDNFYGKITVKRGPVTFPGMCPVCLSSNADVGVKVESPDQPMFGFTKSIYFMIPHCLPCSRKIAKGRGRLELFVLFVGSMVIGLTIALSLLFPSLHLLITYGSVVVIVGLSVYLFLYVFKKKKTFDEMWIYLDAGLWKTSQETIFISNYDKNAVTFTLFQATYHAQFCNLNKAIVLKKDAIGTVT